MTSLTTLLASYQARHDTFGAISEPQWRMLMDLEVNGATRATSVCAASGTAETTGLRHLDALQKAGFVTRRRDPKDRRAEIVSLTTKAERAFADFLLRMDHAESARRSSQAPRLVA
jgi:DNA-binding MarR family transcriptional regulator